MAISTYSELQTAITEWMDRSDLSGNVVDFITLAEARLNRKIEFVETTTTLTGVVGSRNVDVSALSIIEPMQVYLTSSGTGDETEVDIKGPGTFPFSDDSGFPGYVSLDADNLVFDRPLDEAYSIRFRYRGRFALSDAAPTNDLLTDHPDVYLAASIVWGGIYIADVNKAAAFKSILDEFIKETRNHLAQRRRGVISPDPALAAMTSRNVGYWNGE